MFSFNTERDQSVMKSWYLKVSIAPIPNNASH